MIRHRNLLAKSMTTNEKPSPQNKKRKMPKPKPKPQTTKSTMPDRLSDLPDHLAHRILSSLGSYHVSARTRLLSKHWNRLADSFPILEFRRTSKPKPRSFPSLVDRTLSKFLSSSLRIERFLLETGLGEPELPSLIDKWIESAVRNGAREIVLVIDRDSGDNGNIIHYRFPETAFRDSPRLDSLRKLFLSHVTIDDAAMGDVVRLCCEISHIRLFQCRGFETLAIRSLRKLEIVEVSPPRCADDDDDGGRRLRRVEIVDTPSLRTFTFKPSERNFDCTVSLAPCPNLRELGLSNCDTVTDEWLRRHVTRLPLLEDLEIVDCHELRRVSLSAKRLRSLRILGCDNVIGIDLVAPSLSEFRLQAYEIPVLSAKNIDARCDFTVHFLYRGNDPADSSWFLRLREFLQMPKNNNNNKRKFNLEVGFYGNKVTFDREELREAKIPEPHEAEELVLSLGAKATSVDCGALIDGLLWSCHPKRISIDTYSALQESTTKVLGEKLFDRESYNKCCCCDSCVVKCWRHDLKSVTIVIVSNREDDDGDEILISLRSLLRRLPLIRRDNYKVFFQLSWYS